MAPVIPLVERPQLVALLLVGTALYLVYHYGSQRLGVYGQRVLGFVVLGVVPALLAAGGLSGGLAAHGLMAPRGEPSAWFLALVILVVLPILVLAQRSPRQWSHYPQLRPPCWDLRTHLLNAATWGLYLLGYELFFRGILTFALAREVGAWPGVAIVTALYVAVHLPKPAGEAVGTLPMGLIFGLTALVSDSILAVWLGHWMIAVTSDVAAQRFAAQAGRPAHG